MTTLNQNILFSTGVNLVESAFVSGGPTSRGYPLVYAQNQKMWQFARFSSLVSADTWEMYEWRSDQNIQLVGAMKHSCSPSAKWRVRIGASVATILSSPVYDSGWVRMSPVYSGYGSLAWGEFDWAGAIDGSYTGLLNSQALIALSEEVAGKVLRIDYDDATENTEGYVQKALVWASPIYQPSINVEYGVQVAPIEKTRSNMSESGVRTYAKSYMRRTLGFSVELPIRELMYKLASPYVLAKGSSSPIVCILQPLDLESYFLQAVYGNLVMEPIAHSNFAYMRTSINIDERV